MAEGLLRQMGGNRFEVHSAGVAPSHVRSEAIQAMSELDIDISHHRSKSVEQFAGQESDYVITVCDNANQNCPTFPGKTMRVHWSLDDPAVAEGDDNARVAEFRRVRDQLRDLLREFIDTDQVRLS